METKTYRAIHRRAPMTPRKARYVADLVRGRSVDDAIDILKFCARRAAPMYLKVLMSALANAEEQSADRRRLHLVDVRADDGPTMRRWKTRSRGQMFPLLIRSSHLTVVLAEREPEERGRSRGGADRSRAARVRASREAQQRDVEPKPVPVPAATDESADADASTTGKEE